MSENHICLSSDEEGSVHGHKRKYSYEVEARLTKSNDSCKSVKTNILPKTDESVISLDSDDDETDVVSYIVANGKENDGNGVSLPEEIIECSVENNTTDREANTEESCSELRNKETEEGARSDDMKREEIGENSAPSAEESGSCELEEDMDMLGLTKEAVLFLDTCKKQFAASEHIDIVKKKIPSFIRVLRKISKELAQSEYLKVLFEKHTALAAESFKSSLISFKEVYEYLKENAGCEGIEMPKEQIKLVKRLEKVIKKVLARIKELEEEEVDFNDDENNSPYIKLERYSQRLNKLHRKYCQILKKNPYAGRITYERIDFMSSNYNEINLAICKTYRNNKIFPSYEDIYKLIEKTVEENNLGLNSCQIKSESSFCFKKLGHILQQRRKKDLYDTHREFILDEDPAAVDKELDARLRNNSKEAKIKMDLMYEEFVRKQELGEGVENDCSSDGEEEDAVDSQSMDQFSSDENEV